MMTGAAGPRVSSGRGSCARRHAVERSRPSGTTSATRSRTGSSPGTAAVPRRRRGVRRTRRRRFAAALVAIDERDLDRRGARGLACIRSALGFLGSLEPVEGRDDEDGARRGRGGRVAHHRGAAPLDRGSLRRGGERDRRRWRDHRPADRVRAPGDRGPIRPSGASSSRRWRRSGGRSTATGMRRARIDSSSRPPPSGGRGTARSSTRMPPSSGSSPAGLEGMLWRILAAGRDVVTAAAGLRPGRRVEPWDYRFVVGAAERRLLDAIPLARLRAVNDAHLRVARGRSRRARDRLRHRPAAGSPGHPGRVHDRRPAADRGSSRATREGGLGNLGELLHESGHALHVAAIDTRPGLRRATRGLRRVLRGRGRPPGLGRGRTGRPGAPPGRRPHRSSAACRATAACCSTSAGRSSRSSSIARPAAAPNDVWTEIVADGLGVEPHPEWSWWAVRGQLIESPGYIANYALSAITAAALRARIRELRGDWSAGDPGWYGFVSASGCCATVAPADPRSSSRSCSASR